MLNIHNRTDIFERLNKLDKDATPIFGKMSAQHMVEHLSIVLKFSNGKLMETARHSKEKSEKWKQLFIYTDKELPEGVKAPFLGDEPPSLENHDILTAIHALQKDLDDFETYFKENNDAKPIHPFFAELDYDEWVVFHNKHFQHHFRQFQLV